MLSREEINKKVKEIRENFPIFSNNPNMIYLDSAATSLKPKCVIDKMEEYYYNYGVNIHRGVYKLSYNASDEYEIARKKVANFINAKKSEIIFTKNVTESLNQICLMLSERLNEGDEIFSDYLEHHSSLLPWQNASKKHGFKLTYINLTNDGHIDFEDFKNKINEKSKVLAITLTSNVLGYVTEIKKYIELAHKNNMIVIVDAAQSVAHMKIDVKEMDCDFLAFSSHKMMGPTGVGVLYGKKELLKGLKPVFYGGDMNDEVFPYDVDIKETPYGFEAGTPAIAEVIGLGRAIDFINSIGFDEIKLIEDSLKEYMFTKIKDLKCIDVYNMDSDNAVLAFNVKNVHPHDASTFFDEENICLRAGHHCAELLSKWLHVNGTLRASLYIYNNYDDIDKLVNCIERVNKFFNGDK